jgi:NAD-dependent dihydropyrimidine dehydrogenase PreA subunit/flavodoxin
MKTVMYYFSATGNTARAVQAIAERLKAAGQEVWLQPVDQEPAPPHEIPDLTVVAFPIWSWAAPHFILEFVRRMPRASGARAAVFSTGGSFGGQGVGEVERLLRKRGYSVVGSGEAIYPENWVLGFNPPVGEKLKDILATGDEQVARFADSLLSAQPEHFHCAWIHRVWSRAIALLFRTTGRRTLGKMFIADDTCTSCALCETRCPVHSIRMVGTPSRPQWNASCASCYRCINLCPVKAIQISLPLMILQLSLSLGLTVLCWFPLAGLYRQLVACPGFARIGLTAVATGLLLTTLTIVQLTVLSRAFDWLATRMPLRSFFLRNYTHRFGRYRAPGFRLDLSDS